MEFPKGLTVDKSFGKVEGIWNELSQWSMNFLQFRKDFSKF